jgi:hypothetical protein
MLLTVLSVAAERLTNVLKLRNSKIRSPSASATLEKRREYRIQGRSVIIGMLLAALVKADLFSIIMHLDDPWTTIGWVHVTGGQWFRSYALTSWGAFFYTIGGCALTGIALGFGSKFWHDFLSVVNELRAMAHVRGTGSAAHRAARAEAEETAAAEGGSDA